MKVDIKKIIPNNHRDFILYPISKEQVEKLAASITKDTFWAGLPARELEDGTFEILAGHHRLEAAKKVGMKEIDLIVAEYDDDAMASIMVAENLTQRGSTNFGATIEAVAAVARNLAKEIHAFEAGDEPSDVEAQKAWAKLKKSYDTSKGYLLNGRGVGREKVVAALDGSVTQYVVGQAINVLKETGMYRLVLKGIVGPKILKDKYSPKDAKAEKSYAAIASFDTPSLGVAFMKAAVKGPSLTKAQYLVLANTIKLNAAKDEKLLTASVVTKAVDDKTGFVAPEGNGSNGEGKSLTAVEQQIVDENNMKEAAEKLGELMGVFMANYDIGTVKLMSDFEWPDNVKKSITTFLAYDIMTEEEAIAKEDAEDDTENDTDAETAGLEEADKEGEEVEVM